MNTKTIKSILAVFLAVVFFAAAPVYAGFQKGATLDSKTILDQLHTHGWVGKYYTEDAFAPIITDRSGQWPQFQGAVTQALGEIENMTSVPALVNWIYMGNGSAMAPAFIGLFSGTIIQEKGFPQAERGISSDGIVLARTAADMPDQFGNAGLDYAGLVSILDRADNYKNYQVLYNAMGLLIGPKAYLAAANQPAGIQGSVFGVSQQPVFTTNSLRAFFQHIAATDNLPEFQAIDRAMLETLYDPRVPGTPDNYDSIVPVVWADNTRYAPVSLSVNSGGTFTIDADVAFTDTNRKQVTNDYTLRQIWRRVGSGPDSYEIPVNHKLHVTFVCGFENNDTDVICHVTNYTALADQQQNNQGALLSSHQQADICAYVQGQPDVHLHMDRLALGPWTNSLDSSTSYIWADWSPVTAGELGVWKLDRIGFVKP